MNGKSGWVDAPRAILAALLACSGPPAFAQTDAATGRELRELKEQLKQQQGLIDELSRKLADLEEESAAEPPDPKGAAAEEAVTEEIGVSEKGELRVDFTLGISNLPQY